MKKLVRLTESDLHRIVKESVNMILETEFKQVDNLNDYIQQNNLQMKPASKFQRVNAQSGKSYINQYGKQNGMDKRQIGRMVRKGGAPLSTVAGDGTQETNNMVTKNHTVLNNVGNTSNKWASETSTFARKYEQDPTQQGVYKPKGGPMNAAQINEPISFTAPWGERMNVDKGGYILQDPNNPNDIYGISGKDFDSTYRFNEGKNRIRVSEAQLHQIVKESIEQVLDEGFFDKFRRTANARDAYKGLDGDYSYNKDEDRFYYHDKYGNKHDTGIGYGKGNVGTNWNPLKWWNSGDRQVTQNDAKRAKSRLQNFDNGKGNPFTDRGMIDNTARRNYDKEQEHRKEEASRRRREEEQQYYERNKGQYSRPQQQGNGFSTADLIYGVDRKH